MSEYKKKRIEVLLSEDEIDFLKWFAKYDGVTVADEMKSLFMLQLHEEMDLHLGEWKESRDV